MQHMSSDLLWEALDALSRNQMELAAGKHHVLKVLRQRVPIPRWELVVSGMPHLPAKPETTPSSHFVYFDGWDLYATKEEALDCTFVHPLVRTTDADYEELDAEDAAAFTTNFVDGNRSREGTEKEGRRSMLNE